MQRLRLLPLSLVVMGVAGLTAGCVVDHELGETATETGESTGTPATDDGSSGGGGSQSNTSTPTAGGTDTGGPDTGDDGSSSSGDEGTTGEPVACDPGDDFLRWAPTDFVEPIPGVVANFAAVLGGTCTVGALIEDPAARIPTWRVPLVCTMSGRLDGDANVVDQSLSLSLDFTSAMDPAAYVGSLAGEMELRLVADWWGMGWDRWFVLARPDGTIVFDAIDAQIESPEIAAAFPEELAEILQGQPWHGDLAVSVASAECGDVNPECGGQARALAIGWQDGPAMPLHEGQQAEIGTTQRELSYGISVSVATAIPRPVCTDTPSGEYGMSAWAIEP
jgi:hypothetical protein